MGTFGAYMGSMAISKKRRDEFAGQMMKILNYGGMMNLEMVSMYGHELYLLCPLKLFPEGRVDFHFNYFEDRGWENAGFDAKDGYFYSNKIGGQEFNDVVMAAYLLYEMWDDTPGLP